MQGPFSAQAVQAEDIVAPSAGLLDVPSIHAEARAALQAALDRACGPRARPQVLAVTGEAGAGKSHLLAWLRRQAGERAVFVLLPPFPDPERPFRHLLRHLGEALRRPCAAPGPFDDPLTRLVWHVLHAQAQDRVEAALAPEDGGGDGPELARLLGPACEAAAAVPEAQAAAVFAAQAGPLWPQVQVHEGLLRYLHSLPAEAPVDAEVRRALCEYPLPQRRERSAALLCGDGPGFDDEAACRRLAAALSRLSPAPLLLCHDRVETAKEPGLRALTETVREIFLHGGAALQVLCCEPGEWTSLHARLTTQLRRSPADRQEHTRRLALGPLGAAPARELLQARAPGRSFDEAELRGAASEGRVLRTPRELLRHFEHAPEAPASPPAVETAPPRRPTVPQRPVSRPTAPNIPAPAPKFPSAQSWEGALGTPAPQPAPTPPPAPASIPAPAPAPKFPSASSWEAALSAESPVAAAAPPPAPAPASTAAPEPAFPSEKSWDVELSGPITVPEGPKPAAPPPPAEAEGLLQARATALAAARRSLGETLPGARATALRTIVKEVCDALRGPARPGIRFQVAGCDPILGGGLRLQLEGAQGGPRVRAALEICNADMGPAAIGAASRLGRQVSDGRADVALLVREAGLPLHGGTVKPQQSLEGHLGSRGGILWLGEDEIVELLAVERLLQAASAGSLGAGGRTLGRAETLDLLLARLGLPAAIQGLLARIQEEAGKVEVPPPAPPPSFPSRPTQALGIVDPDRPPLSSRPTQALGVISPARPPEPERKEAARPAPPVQPVQEHSPPEPSGARRTLVRMPVVPVPRALTSQQVLQAIGERALVEERLLARELGIAADALPALLKPLEDQGLIRISAREGLRVILRSR